MNDAIQGIYSKELAQVSQGSTPGVGQKSGSLELSYLMGAVGLPSLPNQVENSSS